MNVSCFVPRYSSLALVIMASVLAACATPVAREVTGAPATLRDVLPGGAPGPELVVIPAGTFLMGSPDSEDGRYADESPRHRVIIARPFALGRTEVTVGDFRKFVQATGYVTAAEEWHGSYRRNPGDAEWEIVDTSWRYDSRGEPARDDLPVVHVSWNDARAYVEWLSSVTGHKYRLPSEAEFEYANRAGTTTKFWWGQGVPRKPVANIRGERDRAVADGSWNFTAQEEKFVQAEGNQPLAFSGYGDGHWWPAPAGSLASNPFGVADTAGNVWEWTADCWHDDYTGAPTDGSAWAERTDCESRSLRGGSYYCAPRHVRSANRWRRWAVFRAMYIGFRVARDL